MIPVVISTREGREEWLNDLVDTIPMEREYRVVVGWEIEAIKEAYLYLVEDEFLFLQDSTRVKDPGFWRYIDSWSGTSRLLMPRDSTCYMGIYQRSVLDLLDWEKYPVPSSTGSWEEKMSIGLGYEKAFVEDYCELGNLAQLSIFPDVNDRTATQRTYNGRNNLCLENEYFVKYKGYWR